MFQALKIEAGAVFTFLCLLCLVVSPIKGSTDCANITNITRISASSVLVEWDYMTLSRDNMLQESFEIKVFDNNASQVPVLLIPHIMGPMTLSSYLVSNLSASMQHLCFTVQLENIVMSPTSSGDTSGSEGCRKECLPLLPQVPNAPEGFSYQPTTFSSAEVTFLWNATEGPVLLACRKNDNTVPTIIREFCGCCSPVNVTEFTHSSEYTCSLSKRNGVVVGPSSTITFTTDADRLAPPNFSITEITSTSVTIQIFKSQLQYIYQICIPTLQNGQCILTTSEVVEISDDLYPFTTYHVQVEVRRSSSMSWSYPSRKSFTTLEEAPGNISLVSAHLMSDSSMIFVSWRPPEINNGSIIAYMYCWSSRLAGLSELCKNTTGNSTIIHLMPGTVYSVKVAAFTKGGGGPFSNYVYVNIPGAAIPTSGYVSVQTSDYIQMKFKGINDSHWQMNYSQTLKDNIRDDIVNSISAQVSNACGCNFSLPTNVTIKSIKAGRNESSDSLLLNAFIGHCTNSHCAQQQHLKYWYRGPTPHVMIGNGSTFLLLLDRTCPLYTTTLNSAECQSLEPPADCSSDNGGAIAGALIGGILLGAAMTMIGVALAAFGLLWYRRQHHDADKAKMMKQLDTGVETPLSMRYIPADKNINARSNEDNYEPVSPYTHDSSDDTGLENPYESIQGLAVKSGQKENKKHVTFTKGSRENSGQKVIREDDSGYVLPDVLWEGKQRPAIAPAKIAQAQIPNKTTTSTVSVMIPPATEAAKVEYDVPEGVNVSKSHTHVQPSTSKIKGQREPSSQQPTIAVASQNQPSQLPDRSGNSGQGSKTEQPPTGKGHHKQLQRLVSKEKNSQHDLTQAQPQSSKSKEKGLTKPTKEEGAKPAKKVKPKLQQNASKLAQQYQTDSTKTTAQSHDTVKSKLQNLLSPSLAQGPAAHTPVLRQVSSSATVEKKVVQGSDSPASKVKAMASMLEGGVGGQAASSSETPDSKNAGAKRKPLLPMPGKTAGSSSTVPRAQHPSQAQGASESKIPPQQLLPTKKPKPAGKGAANISMKANKAYEKWAYDEAGGSGNARPTQNLRGGGHGNENLYHY